MLEFTLDGCTSVTDPLYYNVVGGPCNDMPIGARRAKEIAAEAAKVEKGVADARFRLYPNPAKTDAVLDYELETANGQQLTVYLYNLLGVQLWQASGNKQSGTFTVPSAGLPAGQYRVVVYADGVLAYETTLIKN